jgi:MFS transporter, CP family, cyanate transporter
LGIVEPITRTRTPLLAALTVLLVAANLRAAITSVGPVVDRIGAGTGLSSTALGLLGAVPLLTFAAVSPLVHRVSGRFGPERTVFGALLVLVAGTVIRSLPGPGVSLWLGTVLLGAAIAVGNVLLPAIVKRVTSNVALLTSLYTSVMGGVAALASGVSVTLAGAGTWRLSLGLWAVLGVPAMALLLPRIRTAPEPPPPEQAEPTGGVSVWRSGVAWSVALYMALQSTAFYLLITWLPSIEADAGVSPSAAGWHLFIFQIIGLLAGLAAGPVIRARADQRAIAAATGGFMLVAVAGLWLAPAVMLLWVTLAGVSSGMAIVVALSFFGLRTRTAAGTAHLSGMAQGVGYLIAAGGPFGAGALHQATGGWTAPLLAEMGVAAAQTVLGVLAGRDRFIG